MKYGFFLPMQFQVASTVHFVLPLWIPFLLVTIPMAHLWYRDRRRRIAPGHCPKCGYDLTKNESGRCPECGVECERIEGTKSPLKRANDEEN